MIDALENKVSELIAENGTLKLSNIKLNKKHQEYEADIAELKQKVEK
jgi:regulator of replication initiation timing